MTLHVSSRFVSRLVVFAAILLRLPTPVAAQSSAVPPATPGLDERLERLAARSIATASTSTCPARFSSSSAGDDRLRLDLDLSGSVQIRTVLNAGRAWKATSGAPSEELTGKSLAQTRLGHPSIHFGDWRKYYDDVRVVREGASGGRKGYAIQLESAGLPPTLVFLDAETGDILQTRQTMWSVAGPVPLTTTYSDYREVGGMRVPHRYIESSEMGGRTIYQVERVEVGVELAPDTFTLERSATPGRGR